MKYEQLNLRRARKPQRKGRGIAAGQGKTAGRGTKGQGSRKSGGVRPGFEGGQMPLYMRLPHLRGFRSFKVQGETVTTGELEQIKAVTVDTMALFDAGLIGSPYTSVKLVVKGELKTKKDVKLPAASAAAIKMIESAGGKFYMVNRLARQAKNKDTTAKA